ncbi:hypothetical protein B0J18DRAFT_113842 [Chaetomium sp. MPI-SDFR-AT-0129]|nr:hypothetical protein B0J18DRAFT_113842 [Chaetomium sp. MPI-SDFR-AT-0129]
MSDTTTTMTFSKHHTGGQKGHHHTRGRVLFYSTFRDAAMTKDLVLISARRFLFAPRPSARRRSSGHTHPTEAISMDEMYLRRLCIPFPLRAFFFSEMYHHHFPSHCTWPLFPAIFYGGIAWFGEENTKSQLFRKPGWLAGMGVILGAAAAQGRMFASMGRGGHRRFDFDFLLFSRSTKTHISRHLSGSLHSL